MGAKKNFFFAFKVLQSIGPPRNDILDVLMLRMDGDLFVSYHDAALMPLGPKLAGLGHKVYIDYCKTKSMFYMMETFLCIVVKELVVLSKLKNWYFRGVMLFL